MNRLRIFVAAAIITTVLPNIVRAEIGHDDRFTSTGWATTFFGISVDALRDATGFNLNAIRAMDTGAFEFVDRLANLGFSPGDDVDTITGMFGGPEAETFAVFVSGTFRTESLQRDFRGLYGDCAVYRSSLICSNPIDPTAVPQSAALVGAHLVIVASSDVIYGAVETIRSNDGETFFSHLTDSDQIQRISERENHAWVVHRVTAQLAALSQVDASFAGFEHVEHLALELVYQNDNFKVILSALTDNPNNSRSVITAMGALVELISDQAGLAVGNGPVGDLISSLLPDSFRAEGDTVYGEAALTRARMAQAVSRAGAAGLFGQDGSAAVAGTAPGRTPGGAAGPGVGSSILTLQPVSGVLAPLEGEISQPNLAPDPGPTDALYPYSWDRMRDIIRALNDESEIPLLEMLNEQPLDEEPCC